MKKLPYIFYINKDSEMYYINFYIIFIYLIICMFIAFIIFILSYVLIKKTSYVEKLIPYECGFEPYEDTRNVFDIQFYLVALLFLVFDLESLFLYPLVFSLPFIKSFGMFILFDFFLELFLGYLIIYKYILKNILE